MLKVGLGQSEGIDTQKTVQAAIAACKKQLQDYRPQAGIVFAGINFEHRLMLDEIYKSFPQIDLVGCTTAGEFSSSYGFSDESIVLMMFFSDDIEIKSGIGRDIFSNPAAAVTSAVNQARDKLVKAPSLCLAFPDGFNRSFDPVMELLNKELGFDCPIFGGVAGTQWFESQDVLQFYNDEITRDSMPILLWGGPLAYSFAIANSWTPVGRKTMVTDSSGRIVKKIGDFEAVDFYRYYLGDHTDPAQELVLAVYDKSQEQPYLRAPLQYHPDGSITFSESIPQGAVVQLTEAIREVIIEDTQTTVNGLSSSCGPFQPAVVLAFSCAFRKEILGTRTEEELHILRRHLPAGIPISGFYSFGEIAPLKKGQESLLHGATLVTLLMGHADGEAHAIDGTDPAHVRETDALVRPETDPGKAQNLKELKLENKFLSRKLKRSESYRKRLEEIKDFNSAMHRKIMQEVNQARREIQRKGTLLRKSEEKYRRIVETAGEGFILMDENLVLTDVNDALCRMVGYSRDELLGKSPLDLATEEYKQFLLANREELLAKEYRQFEGVVVAKNGSHVPILVHGSILKDDKGEVIGQMAFITDMTEHKKALMLAGEVQKSLLPKDKPHIPGFDVAGKNVSCDEIGGDYFDFLWHREAPKEPFSIVVGDIAGHGVDSALLMTSARAFLRMRASQPGSIADIINAMNQHLAQDVLETGSFMTLFYLTIDPGNDCIEWIRAGHDPAIIYDPMQDVFEELKGAGLALGVDERFCYTANRKTGLAEGRIIAIGTDGIWEACDKSGKMFGKKRFREIIRRQAHTKADDILNAVYDELSEHTKGQRSEDDITLVIVKIGQS